MNIGVFDSGIGGQALAGSLSEAFPEAQLMVVDDRAHVPYGSRGATEIIRLTDAAIQPLLRAGCDIIVLACNTATAVAIDTLRQRYPATPFIGIEPMLKAAAERTKNGIIGICATPATLASERYKKLKRHYASHLIVLEPDCSDWARMIEAGSLNRQHIGETIEALCDKDADVIVLGCTHYHWIKQEIELVSRHRAAVIEPSEAIARRVAHMLGKTQLKVG